MAKPNYNHTRKQKELARKARQQEKQQRRMTRPVTNDQGSTAAAVAEPKLPPGGGK